MKLTDKELKTFTTIENIVNHEITKQDAELLLGISRRQINRLIIVYNNQGKNGFIHKNRGKVSEKKINYNIILELEKLYLEEYYDYNFEAFYEEIEDKYSISYSVLLTSFKRDDIISPMAHKKTVKLYNEKMNNAIKDNTVSEDKKELYEIRKIAVEQAHIRRSSNLYFFGQEVQMDAAFDTWFGSVSSALHLAVDKGTKKVLYGWFEFEEVTSGYYILLYNIVITYGIPKKIKTDNRSTFNANNNKKTADKTTQFALVCNDLNIALDTTSIPTHKANVERENKTFKCRLKAVLRHENITTIEEANRYLNEVFIPKMNNKFSYDINPEKNMMRENNYSQEELNLIFSYRNKRIIDNASTIHFENKYYIPIDKNTGEVVAFKGKTEAIVLRAFDGTYWSKIENEYFELCEIEKRTPIPKQKTINSIPKERKKYIPPANHPWRNYNRKATQN